MAMDLTWILNAKDNATPSFDKVKQSGIAAADGINGAFGSVLSTFNLLPTAIGALSAVAAGGVFKSIIGEAVSWDLAAGKLAKTLGTTPEAASIFNVAMRSVGVDTDLASAAALRLSKTMSTNEQVFTDMGVKVKDSNGNYRDTIAVMMDVNQSLTNEKAGFDRNTAAMTIYGRSWGEVQQMLKITDKVMNEAEETATRLHLKVGKEGVSQALAYKSSLRELNLVAESLKVQLGSELLPMVVSLSENFGGTAVSGALLFSDALKLIKNNSTELEVTLAALAAPRILAGLGTLAATLAGMGGASGILTAAQTVAMANPITAGVVLGAGVLYAGYKAVYGPEEDAAYANLAKAQDDLGARSEKLNSKLTELGYHTWEEFSKAEKKGEVVFDEMNSKWVVKPKADTTDVSKALTAVTSEVEKYGKSIEKIGKSELDMSKIGFTEDLKRQQELLKTNSLQMYSLEQPLRSYLDVIGQVYDQQISMQQAIGQTLFKIGADQKAMAQQNVAIATTEKAQTEARLEAWTQYLTNLKSMHASTLDSMKKKQQELFDIQIKTGDLTLQVQQQLMTPMQKYYSTVKDLDNKEKLSMSLNSDEKIKLLSSVQQSWSSLTSEIKDGDTVLLSQTEAVAQALSKIKSVGSEIEVEKGAQIGAARDQLVSLDAAMLAATNMIDSYQLKIRDLDATIAALTRTFDLTMTDKATPVIDKVKGALDAIKDKTVTITTNYVSAYSGTGSSGLGDIPQYASGTPYVPRTGLALIHQGERITTAKDNASGNYGGSVTNSPVSIQGGIQITLPNVTNQSTADDFVRQMMPAIKKYSGRSL